MVKRAISLLAILSLVAQRSRHLQSRVYPGMAREQRLFKSCADYSSSCSHALSNHHPSTARASSSVIIGQRKEGNVETAKHKDRSHGQFAAIGASGDHFDRIRKVVATATPLQRQTKHTSSQRLQDFCVEHVHVRITHPRLSGIITFTNRFTPVLNTRRRAAWFLIKAV